MADREEIKLEVSAAKINSCVNDHHNGKLLANSVYIKNTDTTAQIQSKLNAGGSDLSVVFDAGEYTLTDNISVWDLDSLTINFNGAIIRSESAGGFLMNFSTQPSTHDKYFRIPNAAPEWFLSNIEQNVYYVDIADRTNFGNIARGDMFIVSDTTVSESGRYTMGLVLFFDHFEEVLGVDRMYFSKPPQHQVLCKDALLFKEGFGDAYYVCHIPLKGQCNLTGFNLNNVGIYTEGFEVVNVDNATAKQDIFPFVSKSQISIAMSLSYSRYINVNNYTAWGYNRAGYGYGITSLAWDEMNISNMIGWYCRHCITSSTTYHHYSNQITVSNSYFAGAQDQYDDPAEGTACIDTHVGVWDLKVDNCTIEGAQIGVHLRGNGVVVTNTNFNHCHYAITTDGDEPLGVHKKKVLISNCNVKDNFGSFFKADVDVTIDEVVIDHVNCDFSGTPAGIDIYGMYTAGETAHVEDLTISNSIFKGRIGTSDTCTFLGLSNTATTKGIAKIKLYNNHISQFNNIITSQLPLQDITEIKGNTFEKFGVFYQVDTVDNIDAVGFLDCLIEDNIFRIGKALFDISFDTFKINDLKIYKNHLELIGDLFINSSGGYFYLVRLVGNHFINSLYGGGRTFNISNTSPVGYILEQDNTYYKIDQTVIDAAITAYSASGYTAATPKYDPMGALISKYSTYPTKFDVIGNKYYTGGWADEYFNLTGVECNFIGNKFIIDTLNYTKFFDLATCNAQFINNDVVLGSVPGTTEIIESSGAGGVTKVVGNNIINNSVAQVVRLFDFDDISYLDLGNNTYRMNTASTIDNCTDLGA